jgi:hypothetical protein
MYHLVPTPESFDIVSNRFGVFRFRLDPRQESTDEFHVLRNGSLLVPFLFSSPLTAHEYCLDPVPNGNGSLVLPMICFPPLPADEPVKSVILTIYPIGEFSVRLEFRVHMSQRPVIIFVHFSKHLVTLNKKQKDQKYGPNIFCAIKAYICIKTQYISHY